MNLLRTSFGLVKLATKAGLAGGAMYYSYKFGIWGNTQETEVGYTNLKSAIQTNEQCQTILNMAENYRKDNEFLKQRSDDLKKFSADMKSKVPEFPASEFGSYWNRGVEATIIFLANCPSMATNYATKATTFISKQLKEITSPQGIHPTPTSDITKKEKSSNDKESVGA